MWLLTLYSHIHFHDSKPRRNKGGIPETPTQPECESHGTRLTSACKVPRQLPAGQETQQWLSGLLCGYVQGALSLHIHHNLQPSNRVLRGLVVSTPQVYTISSGLACKK